MSSDYLSQFGKKVFAVFRCPIYGPGRNSKLSPRGLI